MAKMYLIMGKSSTGKDSIFKKLLERSDVSLRRVVPYTTRPIRSGEENGKDYIFCDENTKKDLEKNGRIVEIRSYPTVHGNWEYFTVDNSQIAWDREDMIMIGTLESYQKLNKYYTGQKIIPIYIEVEDGIRLQRALDRERSQKCPRYEEMCRRYLADSEDFSKEKLEELGINKVFYNDNVDKTVDRIAEFIKKGV